MFINGLYQFLMLILKENNDMIGIKDEDKNAKNSCQVFINLIQEADC